MQAGFINIKGMKWFQAVTVAFLALSLVFAPMIQSVAAVELNEQLEGGLKASSAEAFLNEFFAADYVQPHYVGASVIIVKDGKVLAQKGYGYADVAQQLEVDPANTVFRVASVSKTFTAVAVMQLVEQGKIDLQEDILTYLPELSFDNPFSTPVTVEHLLTHTTGFEIRDPQPEDIHEDFTRFVEIEDYVHQHMPPVVRKPGSSYMYDNFASLLAGLLVEKVSGVAFQEYMDKNIFQPLGMKNSSYLLEGSLKEKLAVGYDPAVGAIPVYAVSPTVMPHGGMNTTAEDIGKFMIAFLNGGKTSEGQLLSAKSVDLMTEYRTAIHPLVPDTTNGFEAALQIPGAGSSTQVITKAGDFPGFSSYMFLIPEENTGVFLTYNQQGALRNLFYPEFLATFFPQYTTPVDLGSFEPHTAEQLAALSGYYADLRLNSLVTTVATDDSGQLTMSDGFLGLRSLQQVAEYLFVDPVSHSLVAFKVNEQGEGQYLKEPNLNPLGYAQKGVAAAGFADISEQQPYATYIFALQSLGHLPNDANQLFEPQKTVTRGEFIEKILTISNLPASQTEELAFADIAGHPQAGYIQMAFELGMVTGDDKGSFNPNQAITRQEVATMLWRLFQAEYPVEAFSQIEVAEDVSVWAVPAVQMMFALGLHGPEVEVNAQGVVDYQAKKALTRQEEAALYYMLFTQPTYQIAAEWAAQQEAETNDILEGAA